MALPVVTRSRVKHTRVSEAALGSRMSGPEEAAVVAALWAGSGQR